MKKVTNKKWIFVIDTNSYAGNFEREMCAYLTGHVGDCGVGEKFVDEKIAERFEDRLIHECNRDDGCARPVRLEYNSKNQPNSVGILFDTCPPVRLTNLMKDRAKQFVKLPQIEGYKIKILGFRILVETTTVSEWV